MAKAKASPKTGARTVAAKAKMRGNKSGGFIQNIKDGIHTGIEAMGVMLKKITPDSVVPENWMRALWR